MPSIFLLRLFFLQRTSRSVRVIPMTYP